MPDIFSIEKRSEIMSKISGKNTKPEIKFRKALFKEGFRYRINDRSLPGKPDIVLKKYKNCIFINGCFWHGHNCKAAKLPETNKEFWLNKISENKNRDVKNYKILNEKNWKVIVVWQCEIKNQKLFNSKFKEIIEKIEND